MRARSSAFPQGVASAVQFFHSPIARIVPLHIGDERHCLLDVAAGTADALRLIHVRAYQSTINVSWKCGVIF
jgi:hypothetical protein